MPQRHADTSADPHGDMPSLAAYGARRYALRRRTTIARTVAVAAIAITVPYLIWRLCFTISPEWWWLSVLLFICDSYGLFGLTLYVFELWDIDADRAPDKSALPWKVAVLITTYNEPAEVLLPTVACSVALEPKHETWVLDDGHRPEIAELSAKLGARYLSRPDNAHAKAGNLNHALALIDADIIGVLDADHAPSGRFLTATLPYFSDPALAFVQTPQDFYNRDSFEHTRMGRAIYSEEDLFYKGIAPGKNRWQAAFWCGTCAVLRTLALQSVGGVATDTVTEDIHTSVRMYRQGWKGLFLPDVLSHGLAPHDAAGFLVQRHRWAQGNVQSLRLDNHAAAGLLHEHEHVAQRLEDHRVSVRTRAHDPDRSHPDRSATRAVSPPLPRDTGAPAGRRPAARRRDPVAAVVNDLRDDPPARRPAGDGRPAAPSP
jgi:cellulose synthase (UDP-forming)